MTSKLHFSVLIIVKNREAHLHNVLAAISVATIAPDEVIIARMNEEPCDLPKYAFNLSQISVTATSPLPLAAARNAAAHAAHTDTLVFLDVDCIPAPDCFERLLERTDGHTVCMATPLYLATAVEQLDFNDFKIHASAHPSRGQLAVGVSDHYELFWSLGFSINAHTFAEIGGFDEGFTGYGGEDTDFAFTMRKHNIQLYFSTAEIYHQPHNSYDPPLNWLKDIVENATVFKQKWGSWPMEGWLQKFMEQGYIERTETDIHILRMPSEEALKQALKS